MRDDDRDDDRDDCGVTCEGSLICVEGACGCTANAPCGDEETCLDGECTPWECTADAECGAGNECQSHLCRTIGAAACSSVAQCGHGYICPPSGTCAPGDCNVTSDRPLDAACRANTCQAATGASCSSSTTCGNGQYCDGSACAVTTCAFDDWTTICPSGTHCSYALERCVPGAGGCYRDRDCGTLEHCEITTGDCVAMSPLGWTCDWCDTGMGGTCGHADACVNAGCVERGAGAPCQYGVRCGGFHECSPYDFTCKAWSCNSYSCPLGLDSGYGGTCTGHCSSSTGSYNYCTDGLEGDECSSDEWCNGARCVASKCTLQWSCSEHADCLPAYACGPAGKCIPYFLQLCTRASDCPSTSYRCDTALGVCMPRP